MEGTVQLDPHESADVRRTVRMLELQRNTLRNHAEVYSPGACDHGCKVYARRQGCVVRYTLHHSSTYGCPLPAQPVRLAPSRTARRAAA